jgi:adenine-specific DNA-methyltransferase
MRKEEQSPVRIAYERRNRDLGPQLVWRGKDEEDWSDLVTHAPPIDIQEKIHPKVLVDDLVRRGAAERKSAEEQFDLFADFNGVPEGNAKTEFYQHDANWTNRMILGDSLQVMASLAEREGLRGQVHCIYMDPPYGIKFNSNFQWSTTSRTVTDGNAEHITREPEQVKAFRDTWRHGIHSYLTYLRDRLTVARDLLADSGSIFVQIGDANVHRVRALMDEVFGDENFVSLITIQKTGGQPTDLLPNTADFVLWLAKRFETVKFRQPYFKKVAGEGEGSGARYDQIDEDGRYYQTTSLTSSKPPGFFEVKFQGESYTPGQRFWTTGELGFERLKHADRIQAGTRTIRFKRYIDDFPAYQVINVWSDVAGAGGKIYVVQTSTKVVERCILMTTDPGDLILDPTCGSGTTPYVAEQWGRRWITVDTSRVALALARARIMGARYPYYLLADSKDGQQKVAEVMHSVPSEAPTHGDIRQGFVYDRVPHITLKSIANNAEIDIIWEKFQGTLKPVREQLNQAMAKNWEEWEVPREAEDPWDSANQKLFYELKAEQARNKEENAKGVRDCLKAINYNLKRDYSLETLPARPADPWPELARKLHAEWWQQRIARQKEIDISIGAMADFEYLYDRPYDDKRKVRVAGPFTVESLSPHRVLAVDENDELIDGASKSKNGDEQGFVQMILETLKTAGVQQAHKEDKIAFSSIIPWPGDLIGAEGRYVEGAAGSGTEKRAAIFIGPETC